MSINRKEAVRLARKCLPKILELSGNNDNAGESNDQNDRIQTLSENDVAVKSLCRLWAGMGYIYQITVQLPSPSTSSSSGMEKYHFIVKRVVPPSKKSRSMGDERKTISYFLEANFYESIAPSLIEDHGLSIPIPYYVERGGADDDDRVTICMSRLDGSPGRLADENAVRAVLDWLSTLHAATWGPAATDHVARNLAQPVGSYWHLETRPDEHDSMSRRGWEGRLKLAARAIDERLRRDGMQCCIHGDAKDVNMLFTKEGGVGLYDFQYFGKAPPSVDLAYFLCVAVGDTDDKYVTYYHHQLINKLDKGSITPPTLKELEDSVALALCDFQRFMSGWGQWGSDISSVVIEVLDRLDGGRILKSEDEYREAVRREYG